MVGQVAHTLLQLIDEETGQQFASPQTRMAVFVSNLRSALPHAFDWLPSTSADMPISASLGNRIGVGRGASASFLIVLSFFFYKPFKGQLNFRACSRSLE